MSGRAWIDVYKRQQYIRGKNRPDTIKYDCPQLEPILKPTYGCIVYQEQVMQIVRNLAGYTLGRSDLVRRAMSKKKASVMEKERQNFVYGNPEEGVPGCIANGIPEKVAKMCIRDRENGRSAEKTGFSCGTGFYWNKRCSSECLLWSAVPSSGRKFSHYRTEYAPGDHQQPCLHKKGSSHYQL